MAQRYRLVFHGKFLPGLDAAEVAANLAALFKVPLARVEQLLATQPAVIKQDVSVEQGNRYLEVLAEAGLITRLEPVTEPGAEPLPPGAWDGVERRSGTDRRHEADRRARERSGAIQPDRRRARGRRSTD